MIYRSGETELFYATSGDGPEVVLLHPTPVDHRFWLPMAAFVEGYHLILPDLRGHGRSQLGDATGRAPLSIRVLAEDALRLLDKLEIEKAFLCGCSIGGYVLYELWRQAPERIAGMAIFCSKPQPDSPASKARRQETIAEIQAHGTDKFFDAMAQSLLGASARQRNPALAGTVREMMRMEPEAVIEIQRALGDRPDSMPTIKTIDVPLLAVAGGEDTSSSPSEMEVLGQLVHGAEYHMISDAGHYAALEQPERVGTMLGHFLDRKYR
ncbi:MAG TPA: alpha/beta fold hydrolase [Acidisarcina sp.]|nr:alpha/beta fold hydrolase [Acidisarcina sp.]